MSLPTASCRGSARNPLPPFSGLRCRGLTLVLLLCLLGGGSAVFAAGPTTTTTTTAATLAPPSSGTSALRLYTDENYRLGIGDVVHLEVVGVAKYSGEFTIGAGGTIRLGSLPALALENLSLGQARSLLTTRLQVYVKNPQVVLSVNELASTRTVYVSGDVTRKGRLILPFLASLADALAEAGPNITADLRRVQITRNGRAYTLDCRGLTGEGPLGRQHLLRDQDTINVPRLEETAIAVVGQVKTPTVIDSGTAVPLLQALAQAGGPLPNGDLRQAQIHRGDKVIPVDLHKFMEQGQAPEELSLQPGDVLVIPVGGEAGVFVGGAVSKPGTVELRGSGVGRDLLRVVTAAGPNADSDLTRVTVYRDGATFTQNVKAAMETGKPDENLPLQEGDLVFVPSQTVGTVLVTGAVEKRGVVPIGPENERDLLRVVTTSGPQPNSDLAQVTIHRKGKAIVRDLKSALEQGKLDESVELLDGDVVVVPEAVRTLVVTGEVEKPAVLRLGAKEERDLASLVLESGPLPTADLSRVSVSRDGQELVISVRDYIEKGDRTKTLVLQPGDIVRVPSREIRVFFTGAVQRPGLNLVSDEGLRDLARSLSVPGLQPNADLSRVTVRRGDKAYMRNIQAYSLTGAAAETMELQDGDTVVVPSQEIRVLFTGAVQKPGLATLTENDLHDLAGALTTLAAPMPSADLSRVIVRRGNQTLTRNVRAYLMNGAAGETLTLESGDVVLVPSGEASVLVIGAVNRLGTVQLVGDKEQDLLRLVVAAAPTANADLTRVTVYRGTESFVFDLKKAIDDGDDTQTMALKDGDVVKVPSYDAVVIVTGAVTRTGVFGLTQAPEQRDLAKQIMGLTPLPTADLHRVAVYRGGQVIVRDVDAYLYKNDKSQALDLQDGDVVVVPQGGDLASITGAVLHPGAVRVSRADERGLVQLLSAAGLQPNADLEKVTIYRGDQEIVNDLSDLRDGGTYVPVVEVEPGDRVYVPTIKEAVVSIAGMVARQGVFDIADPKQRDLVRVVTGASPTPSADLSRVTVFRKSEVLVRNLKAYLDGSDVNQTLTVEDGDRIVVPELGVNGVIVSGQVARQGVFPLSVGGANDLLSIMALAGPNEATADLNNVVIHRRGTQYVRNLNKLREEADLSQNLQLESGDVIFVPQSTDAINFAGAVLRAGAMSLNGVRQRDLMRLLPNAGLQPNADTEHITIYRKGDVLVANYRNLVEHGDFSQNLTLEPGDLVYVPTDTINDVMVLGAVTRAGSMNVREEGSRDLLRIITAAGPTDAADLTRVTIFHENTEPQYTNLHKLINEGDLSQNRRVQPGDVIVVPKLGQMYVIGGVPRPGAIYVQPGWDIMDALAAAGNIGAGALWKMVLIRRGPDGKVEKHDIDLTPLQRGKLPERMAVKAGDILYVPYSKARGFGWQDIREILFQIAAFWNIFD